MSSDVFFYFFGGRGVGWVIDKTTENTMITLLSEFVFIILFSMC